MNPSQEQINKWLSKAGNDFKVGSTVDCNGKTNYLIKNVMYGKLRLEIKLTWKDLGGVLREVYPILQFMEWKENKSIPGSCAKSLRLKPLEIRVGATCRRKAMKKLLEISNKPEFNTQNLINCYKEAKNKEEKTETNKEKVLEAFTDKSHVLTNFEKYILENIIDEVKEGTGEIELGKVVEKLDQIMEQNIPSNLSNSESQKQFLLDYYDDIMTTLIKGKCLGPKNQKLLEIPKACLLNEKETIYRILTDAFDVTVYNLIANHEIYKRSN